MKDVNENIAYKVEVIHNGQLCSKSQKIVVLCMETITKEYISNTNKCLFGTQLCVDFSLKANGFTHFRFITLKLLAFFTR